MQLFLLRRGGEEIYVGALGHSSHLINYFEVRLINSSHLIYKKNKKYFAVRLINP
jgi:hypothetical protein